MAEITEEQFKGNPTQEQSEDQWANADNHTTKEGRDSVYQKVPTAEKLYPQGYTVVQNNEGKPDTIVPNTLKERIVEHVNNNPAKKKPGPKKATAPLKSIPASTLIEKLESQIAAIKYISAVEVADIPQLPVRARDILIQLREDIENAKLQAITSIQSI